MTSVEELGRRAKAASRLLAGAPTSAKNGALLTAADLLGERAAEIQAANDADLDAAREGGMAAGPLDRLRLTDARLAGMANGLRTVADLPDPVGEILDGWKRPNGLEITRVRVPLGVIAIIYENRPNVTSDAAGLCVKAGNAVILRGSSTALRSNVAVASVLRDALGKHGLPEDAVILVEDTAYETATAVMQLTDYVDCLIPRGGPSLIQSIRENATVPVIIDGDGNCHVYVDAAADLDRHWRSSSTPRPNARVCATPPSRSSCIRRSPTRSFRGSPTRSTATASSWWATRRVNVVRARAAGDRRRFRA
jgi:glutamate-5-semialdehyde dehydrogenase